MPLTPQNTDPTVGVLVPVITKPGQPSRQADAVWGGIVGTLSNQTDLKVALDAKADASALAQVATSGSYADLSGLPIIGSAAAQSIGAFATAAQGAKADVALQGGAGLAALDSAAASKLSGIAPGATANDTDAALKSRANHTGQQALSTLSQSGATTGQVIKWDGTKWSPADESGGGGGGGTWGSITGTLSSQTDLQGALDGKAAASHNHDGVYVKPASLAAVATSGSYADLSGKPTLGSAAAASTGDFATAAQGAKADSALQAADITGKLDKTGGTMTGAISFAGAQTWPTFNQSTTGSAATLTTARTLTIGDKGYNFDGSTSVTWTLAEIGAAATSHTHADATTSTPGFLSAADKTKLDGIEAGAQVNAVTSVAGKTGAVTIASTDVSGLGSMAIKSAVAIADITATGTPGSTNYLRGDGKWETPAGGGSTPAGTIQYFASDPGAGWLKCDGATYLRASYADLAAALPVNLLNCPPSFGGAQYTGLGGNITDIAPVPGTNYLLLHCSGWSGKQLELLEYDPVTQSISRVGAAPDGAAANVGGMSIAQDGATTYVAGATYQDASRLDLFKIVGTTITKLAMPTVPATAKVEAVAFYNGGANLAIGISVGDPTSDVRIWTYSRSGDTFTKLAEVGGLPASPVSFRSMSVSPSGKTLWATLDRYASKQGHLFDISGATITNLTEGVADSLNMEFNVAFSPRADIDLWFSGSFSLFGQYRLGNTNAVIGVGRESNSGSVPPHVGAGKMVAFSQDGSMLVTSSTTAPWHSVFRVSADYVLTPMFACPDVSLTFGYKGRNAIFTPDSRCIVLKSTTNDTLQMIRSDTTKLIVPDIPNGWIKT